MNSLSSLKRYLFISIWIALLVFKEIGCFPCPGIENCDCIRVAKLMRYDIRCQPFHSFNDLINFFQRYPKIRPLNNLVLKGCTADSLHNKTFVDISIKTLEMDCPLHNIDDDALDNVTDLERISMSKPLFVDIPNAVCNIQKLKSLTLTNNRLNTLGKSVCNLTSLTYVSFRYGQLKALYNDSFFLSEDMEYMDFAFNKLTLIEENTFDHFRKLKKINLRENKLSTVDGLFKNTNPEIIDLYNNNISSISEIFHEDMWRLKTIYLGKNPTGPVSSKTFENKTPNVEFLDLSYTRQTVLMDPTLMRTMPSLEAVHLQHNFIKTLPGEFFKGLQSVQNIDLSYCSIRIAVKVFVDLPSLESLVLSGNDIRNLKGLFINLPKLTELYMSQNYLSGVDSGDLDDVQKLQTLDLSENHLINLSRGSFSKLQDLKQLDLSYNNFFQFNFSVSNLKSLVNLQAHSGRLRAVEENEMLGLTQLRILNLAQNDIVDLNEVFRNFPNLRSLNIADNRISTLKRENIPDVLTELEMAGNPWICDCRLQWFVEWLSETNDTVLLDNPTCSSPLQLEGKLLRNLTTEDVKEWDIDCPHPCTCTCKSGGRELLLLVNCSYKELTEIPGALPAILGVLELDNNALVDVSSLQNDSLSHIQELNLRNNSIENFNVSLPDSLSTLRLDGNILKRISVSVLSSKHFTAVTLGNNPWICECETLAFKKWLEAKREVVEDIENIRCGSGVHIGEEIVNLQDKDLCPPDRLSVVLATSLSSVVVIICLGLVFLCCTFEGKAWLYSKGVMCIKEDDDDDDDGDEEGKAYDALLFYSPADGPFALKHIIPGLENEPPKFTLYIPSLGTISCYNDRERYCNAIRMCRRIIAIVSRDFLTDRLCMEILQTAINLHVSVDDLRDIIVIQHGMLPPLGEVDPTMKYILKQRTHVIWGTKLFWQKLRYLMPKRNYSVETPKEQNGDDEPLLT